MIPSDAAGSDHRSISSSRSRPGRCYDRISMSDEHDPVVTVSVLKSELAILRSEFRSELQSEMADLKAEMTKRERPIAELGATTRAHSGILVEKLDGTFRFVTELAARYGIVLDKREPSLPKNEKR